MGGGVDLHGLAVLLDQAMREAQAVDRLTASTELSLDDAYAIQRKSIALRLGRGEIPAGVKMGFTSRSKMRQMGVDEMIWGRLTDGMRIEDGGEVSLDRYIHPRVEPEIAFVMKRRVAGDVSPAEAMAAVDAVCPAIELIDSRYRDFKFTHADVVADNCSSAGFVLGAWALPRAVDNLGVVLEIDGRAAKIGSTAAILGDPARALAAAIRLGTGDGVPVEAGTVIMAGAATEAVHLRPGCHVRLRMQDLGRAGFTASASVTGQDGA